MEVTFFVKAQNCVTFMLLTSRHALGTTRRSFCHPEMGWALPQC